MLQTQVNYWTLMENQRHNLESERLGFSTLEETKRHNLATEQLGFQTLQETGRHNVATENLGFANLDETKRHNLVGEQLGFGNLDVARVQASASLTQAGAAMKQANVREYESRYIPIQYTIEQQNADTAQRNAATREQELEWNKYEFISQNNLNQGEQSIHQQQADTAEKRQQVEQGNVEFNKGVTVFEEGRKAVKDVLGIIPWYD